MGNKVLIIGLDGATWDLINPLIAKGKLPTLKKLVLMNSEIHASNKESIVLCFCFKMLFDREMLICCQ